MSFLDRSREVASTVGAAARKQAKRAQLELEARRIKSRINTEYTLIGRTLYPGLSEGAPGSEQPEVQVAVAEIKVLEGRLAENQQALEDLLRPAEDGPDIIDADPADPPDRDGSV